MRHFKLTIAYDGTDFHGWQMQGNKPTLQGEIVNVLQRLTQEKIFLHGAGRTDAGVHALGQVASFKTESPIPAGNLLKALNDILPASVRVLEAAEVDSEFHPRKSARAKTYRYRLYRADICPPFLARYVWHHPYPLNEEAMKQAAVEVIGEHDFTSFAAVDPERGSENAPSCNVRRIFSSAWRRAGDEFVYEVRGTGFLHHMVRNLVGTFVLVGKGTLSPSEMVRILEARNRSAAGSTAPASGLYLVGVEY